MDIEKMEQNYLEAKRMYYAGEPIMSDDEFDELERKLNSLGSDVTKVVGTNEKRYKYLHPSRMLSLSKYQATREGVPPTDDVMTWMKKFPMGTVFEYSPKFDGNAVNAVYKKGFLRTCITRGNGTMGKNVTKKIRKFIPNKINDFSPVVEVRMEIVISLKSFEKEYSSDFKNPRNFVAGVLGRDDFDNIPKLECMPVEVRIHDDESDEDFEYPLDSTMWLKENGFESFYRLQSSDFRDFEDFYERMHSFRKNDSPYQLDGFVIKAQESVRKEMGDNGHDPNWGLAVKFPPVEARTKVTGIKWMIGTTGELCPVVQLEPMDIDGSTVRKASGYNVGNLLKNGIWKGAEVVVSKSGDIIPEIVKVLEPSDEVDIPKFCSCGAPLKIMDEIHLMCTDDNCSEMKKRKFTVGLGVLGLDGFGQVMKEMLFDAGFDSMEKILNKDVFLEKKLIETGMFKSGKTLSSMIETMESLDEIPLWKLILSLGFDGVGKTSAIELAKYVSGETYSFSGLEKKAVEGFEIGKEKRNRIDSLVETVIRSGRRVKMPKTIASGIGYEMTGKPHQTEFIKTKSDLEKVLEKYGYVHVSLKDASVLLTDDMNSNSGKMKNAKKTGKKILTYESLMNDLGIK